MLNKSRPTATIPTPLVKYWFTVTNTNGMNSIVWRETWALAETWRDIYIGRGCNCSEVTDAEMPKPLKRR